MSRTRQGPFKQPLPFCLYFVAISFSKSHSISFCRNLFPQILFLSILSASFPRQTPQTLFCRNLHALLITFYCAIHKFSPLFQGSFFQISFLVRYLRIFFFNFKFQSALSGLFFLSFLISPLFRVSFLPPLHLVRSFGCAFSQR